MRLSVLGTIVLVATAAAAGSAFTAWRMRTARWDILYNRGTIKEATDWGMISTLGDLGNLDPAHLHEIITRLNKCINDQNIKPSELAILGKRLVNQSQNLDLVNHPHEKGIIPLDLPLDVVDFTSLPEFVALWHECE